MKKDFASLNIGKYGEQSLNQSGKFEEMFQVLRKSFLKNITENQIIETFFSTNTSKETRKNIARLKTIMKGKHA